MKTLLLDYIEANYVREEYFIPCDLGKFNKNYSSWNEFLDIYLIDKDKAYFNLRVGILSIPIMLYRELGFNRSDDLYKYIRESKENEILVNRKFCDKFGIVTEDDLINHLLGINHDSTI